MEEKLNDLTVGQASVIGVVIAVLYFFIMYDDGSAIVAQISAKNTQLTQQQAELNKINKSIEEAEKIRKLVESTGGQLDKVLNYIPSNLNQNATMKILSNEAKVSGVDISNIVASKPKKTEYDFIEEIEVKIQLKGTFGQLMTFLSYLTMKDKIISVKSLKINNSSRDDEGVSPLLSFDAVFSAYRFVKQKEES